jgi:hypothetical protein
LVGPTSHPASTEVSRSWISMLGHRSDPLPMLIANIRLLRLLPHPGGLLRPFFASARRGARMQRS